MTRCRLLPLHVSKGALAEGFWDITHTQSPNPKAGLQTAGQDALGAGGPLGTDSGRGCPEKHLPKVTA